MAPADGVTGPIPHADRLHVGGQWVSPSPRAMIDVIDSRASPAASIPSPARCGPKLIGHNGFKSDFDIGHGGFKQSGIGREGGPDGLLPFLESKAVLLDSATAQYADAAL